MKDELTIRTFKDISSMKPDTAACMTSQGKKILTFHGTAPGLPKWLKVTDSSGQAFFVNKGKLADLLMGRKG